MSSYRLGLFIKKLLKKALKNLAISARKACFVVSFYKRLKARSVIKKRHEHNSFPVNIAKFLRLLVLENICEWLLLTVSMIYCYMGLKFKVLIMWRLSLQSPSHRFSFLPFKVGISHPEPRPDLRSKTQDKYLWWVI